MWSLCVLVAPTLLSGRFPLEYYYCLRTRRPEVRAGAMTDRYYPHGLVKEPEGTWNSTYNLMNQMVLRRST